MSKYIEVTDQELQDFLISQENNITINEAMYFAFELAFTYRAAGLSETEYLKKFNLTYLNEDLNWGSAIFLVMKCMMSSMQIVPEKCN